MLLPPKKAAPFENIGVSTPHDRNLPTENDEVPGGGALGLRRRSAIDRWGLGGCTYRRQQVPDETDESRWMGGDQREVTGGWCLVDVIDGGGYLLITNQLLLICNKLETPTTSHRCLKKKVHLVFQVYIYIYSNLCFFHAFVTNEMGLSVLFLYELVFILPGDVMHIEGGYAKK